MCYTYTKRCLNQSDELTFEIILVVVAGVVAVIAGVVKAGVVIGAAVVVGEVPTVDSVVAGGSVESPPAVFKIYLRLRVHVKDDNFSHL